MPTVGVVINTYKRPESLLRVLQCLADQAHTDFRDIDVVAVNDGSHECGYDEEKLKNDIWPFEFTYFSKERAEDDSPRLYSLKNFGVRTTTGEVIWLLDDDLIFDEHTLFILRLYHMFLASARPVIVPHYADVAEPHHYQNPFSFMPQPSDWDKMRTWVSFAGLSMRREDFEGVGGVDEQRYDGSMGFADLDLGLMLYHASCQVCLVDGITCFIDDEESGSHRTRILHSQMSSTPHLNAKRFVEKWGKEESAEYGITYP